MKVYIKPFCPFCQRLIALLDAAGVSYELIDVTADVSAREYMESLSHQSGVPQVQIANVIIPDYGTEESLVSDIVTILALETVDTQNAKGLTSTLVYL